MVHPIKPSHLDNIYKKLTILESEYTIHSEDSATGDLLAVCWKIYRPSLLSEDILSSIYSTVIGDRHAQKSPFRFISSYEVNA